jgi:hypothetical protein
MNECLGEITVFEKVGGPLTKLIRLDPDRRIICDGSAWLTAGVAEHGPALRDFLDRAFRHDDPRARGHI